MPLDFPTLLNELGKALPNGLTLQKIAATVPKKAWLSNPLGALEQALANTSELDWDKYLLNNADLREAGIDPVSHYIRHGLQEGRKLIARNEKTAAARKEAPKPIISVIVPNFNNAHTIGKAIRSLLAQTLQEIEIIIIDDGSTDDSLKVIAQFAENDPRIKVIAFPANKGTHMARKAGALAARGDYIMFLDSDDFYKPNACETIASNMPRGADILCFNCNVLNTANVKDSEIKERSNWYNGLPPGLYADDEILDLAFQDGKMPHFLWNKAFKRDLLQSAFSEMEDVYIRLFEDQYEYLVIAHKAKSLLKIKDELIHYTVGQGITSGTLKNAVRQNMFHQSLAWEPIANYCKRYGLNTILQEKRQFMLDLSLNIPPYLEDRQIRKFFEGLFRRFGVSGVLNMLNTKKAWNAEKIASRVLPVFLAEKPDQPQKIKKIGIYLPEKPSAVISWQLEHIVGYLKNAGYETIIFSEADGATLASLEDEGVRIVPIAPPSSMARFKSLYQNINNTAIDAMLYLDVNTPTLLWDMILLRVLKKGVMGCFFDSFTQEMMSRGRKFKHSTLLKILQGLDRLFCFDQKTAIYFRAQKIPAFWIPLIADQLAENSRIDSKLIVAVSPLNKIYERLDDLLAIFSDITLQVPDARLEILRQFKDAEEESLILDKIKKLNLHKKIKLVKKEGEIVPWLSKARVVISTSVIQGYELELARALGIPAIAYNIPHPYLHNNDGSMHIANWETAVSDATRYLTDKSSNYSNKYLDGSSTGSSSQDLARLIESSASYSPFKPIDYKDLNDTVRTMAYFAGLHV